MKKRANWIIFSISVYVLFFMFMGHALAADGSGQELTGLQELMVALATQYPILGTILTVLAGMVVLCSVVIAAFPAVDKNGWLAKLVKLFDFLSVFYPKWKATESEKKQ